MTWHTSAWNTWKGLPVPGQGSFSGFPAFRLYDVFVNTSVGKNQKARIEVVLPLEGWGSAAKLAIINTRQASLSK